MAPEIVRPLLEHHGLELAAVGTGGGWAMHKWHFTHADAAIRAQAREFARGIIEAAAALGAPAIIGSMQGKIEGDVTREQALVWLEEALEELAGVAESHGRGLFYEPLNRYETNLFNRLGDAAEFLHSLRAQNITILADLFHMNIEEVSIADALREAGSLVGHVHFADSNRRAIGWGHTEVEPIIEALRDIRLQGYLSGETLPIPNPEAAATPNDPELPALLSEIAIRRDAQAPTASSEDPAVIGRAGHHSLILIADGNYPAATKSGPNAELVCLNLTPGVPTVAQALRAILSAVPDRSRQYHGHPAR